MIEVGSLNFTKAIIDLEVMVATQNELINKLMQASSKHFSQAEINEIQKNAQESVKKKYPDLGVTF